MKKLILLVQSHEDAATLTAAGRVIGRLGCTDLWVLYSPILTIDPKTAVAEIDKDIAGLEQNEKDAAGRGDYESAKGFKQKRDGLLMNRSVEIRNAWKRVSPEDRKKAVGKYIEPFLKTANPENTPKVGWKITQTPEHIEASGWISWLNELTAVWPVGLKPGEFAVMWPGQLAGLESVIGIPITKADIQKVQENLYPSRAAASKVPVPTLPFNHEARRKELESFQPSRVISIAKIKGIKTKLKEVPAIIDEIVQLERTKAALNAM